MSDGLAGEVRAYRNRNYALLVGWVAFIFAAAGIIGALVREGSAAERWAPVLPILALSAFCLLRLARAGVYADAEGIRILNPLRTVRVPWERLIRFSLRPSGGFAAVGFAELVDADPIQIWGIQARVNTVPSRRIPEEIVGQLNARLAAERAARGL